MADIVISIGAKVAECLVGPILDRARYLFCFNQFKGEFNEAKTKLKTRLEEMNERTRQVAGKSEEITLPVKNWLNNVGNILEDTQKLEQDVERGGKSCFNLPLKYSLAKQMVKETKLMIEVKNNSQFEPFSCLNQLQDITYFSSKDFMDFKSRKSTYKCLLEAIKDGKNKMIGLFGMGGSGKTTLAKEVGKEAHDLKLFEKVVMVVVSKTVNVAKLQLEIAEKISLKFVEETQAVRALRLSNCLKSKKVLLILDDVWECLSLEDIGIPLVDEGCTVLLTTRLSSVCVSMDCEPMIELHLITTEEAWELFKKHANLLNDDPSNMFADLGRKIVDECKELPIAIVAVGGSLKRKPIREWESTLWRLKNFQPMDDIIGQGLSNAYACLESSYVSLPSSTTKSLFLLCSMFPDDHEIHKEDLIRFGKRTIALKETIVTMEDARREILDALQVLVDSCLLMSTDKAACVKMHDLVRDVALWISEKQRQPILVDSHAVSNMLVSNSQSLKDTKALSLWNLDGNFKLSNRLCCPTLDTLLLHPHGFIEDFEGMKALKVLALITYGFTWVCWKRINDCTSILQLIVSFTNLHTLCLRGKKLGDISFLGELKVLEILDLRGSQFIKLPTAVVNMKMLKLLDICHCEIEENPADIIGRCDQLEELYIWDDKSVVPENFSFPRLKRYLICGTACKDSYYDINNAFKESLDSCNEAMKAIRIQGFKVSGLNLSMKDLICRANHLWLENCKWDHKHINLFEINHLWVRRCREKRFIIDNLDMNILQTRKVLSRLISLTLIEMDSLEQVFQDSSISFSLPMLQDLIIRTCPKLTAGIFTHATAVSLPNLRKMEIRYCDQLKWLFSFSFVSQCPSLEEIRVDSCSKFERLVDEEAAPYEMQYNPHQSLILFPKLKRINISECNKVRWLLPYSLPFHCPSLETVYISFCNDFERLVGGDFDEEVACGNWLPLLKLRALTLHCMPKLREIFGHEYKLKSLDDKQESLQAKNENEGVKVMNSELCYIELLGLPELVCIWKGPTQTVSLHRLEVVVLSFCRRLRNIFTLTIVTSLPELRTLDVSGCDEFEGIFCEESLKTLSSSIVCFPKLEEITISACDKVRRIFSYSLASHCPSLKEIDIYGCSQLEGVVQAYEGEVAAHHEKFFPELTRLKLLELPKLRDIYPGYDFNRLSTVVIDDCPNIRNSSLESSSDNCPNIRNSSLEDSSKVESSSTSSDLL